MPEDYVIGLICFCMGFALGLGIGISGSKTTASPPQGLIDYLLRERQELIRRINEEKP